jgi:hypothetical protein
MGAISARAEIFDPRRKALGPGRSPSPQHWRPGPTLFAPKPAPPPTRGHHFITIASSMGAKRPKQTRQVKLTRRSSEDDRQAGMGSFDLGSKVQTALTTRHHHIGEHDIDLQPVRECLEGRRHVRHVGRPHADRVQHRHSKARYPRIIFDKQYACPASATAGWAGIPLFCRVNSPRGSFV